MVKTHKIIGKLYSFRHRNLLGLKIIKKILEYLLLFLQSIHLYRSLLKKILYDSFKCQQVLTSEDEKNFLNLYQLGTIFYINAYIEPNSYSSISYRFMALYRERVIGAATLVKDEFKNPYPGWWLYSLRVDLFFRGLGVGEKLMSKLFDFAIENRAKSLCLSVWDKAKPACKFYERLGFRKIGQNLVQVPKEKRARNYLLMKKEFT